MISCNDCRLSMVDGRTSWCVCSHSSERAAAIDALNIDEWMKRANGPDEKWEAAQRTEEWMDFANWWQIEKRRSMTKADTLGPLQVNTERERDRERERERRPLVFVSMTLLTNRFESHVLATSSLLSFCWLPFSYITLPYLGLAWLGLAWLGLVWSSVMLSADKKQMTLPRIIKLGRFSRYQQQFFPSIHPSIHRQFHYSSFAG